VVRNDKSFGVIDMTLSPAGYCWKFVPAPGYAFTDSGSASCH
jgi:alkaline phosphatase